MSKNVRLFKSYKSCTEQWKIGYELHFVIIRRFCSPEKLDPVSGNLFPIKATEQPLNIRISFQSIETSTKRFYERISNFILISGHF